MESGPAALEVGKEVISNVDATKRTLAKPINVQEVKSGKILKFSSIKEAYLYISQFNKVSISTD